MVKASVTIAAVAALSDIDARKQRDGANEQSVEQVPEKKVRSLRARQMSAKDFPYGNCRKRGHVCKHQGSEHRDELCRNQCRGSIRQLDQKAQRARFFLLTEHANRDKRK
jgi:hypothetical protein